ncbi:MAG TPA: glucoamylase family protein [Candidatus Eisenbacteria bacterium]
MPGSRWRARTAAVAAALSLAAGLAGCAGPGPDAASRGAAPLTRAETAFLDTLEHRTFRWFWDLSDARTGLTPDRAPTRSFSSISAVGFALTAYPIGAERGWVTRAQATERVRRTLEYLWAAPQDTSRMAAIGYRGFFYHFLDPASGRRFGNDVELSTMDTALLLGGVLFCQSYFDRRDPAEARVRALAESLYARVDWAWAQVRPPAISHGWSPEAGFLPYDWRGYNEAMLLYILALGSTTHTVGADAWEAWTGGYRWASFQGFAHVGFAPMFGHQYTQVWMDLRGIRDQWMRARGIDYFENSRRAVLAQRAYALENPAGWRDYGPGLWGLSACDGPVDQSVTIEGRARAFRTYAARGASFTEIVDDGTVAPTATGGSIPFAPHETVGALMAMRAAYDTLLVTRYGFVDALNPTLDVDMPVHHGRVVPGVGWFDLDCLGIDQGPILAMIENQRSELVWRTMRRNPHVVRGLRRAGFAGGWLDRAGSAP